MYHLSFAQLSAYLENRLSRIERRHCQNHLARCPHCEERLRQLSYAEGQLRADFRRWHLSLGVSPDFQAIFAELRQPIPFTLNGTGLLLGLVSLLVILLPLLSRADAETFSTHPELINLPSTLEQTDNPALTPEALRLVIWQVTPAPLQYASPAPLPQATALASFEPQD